MIGALIRFARQMVQSVLSALTQQLNIVEEQALNPMRMVIQAVTGGVWRGAGADAFVEEVSSLMIPGVGQVTDQVRTFQSNVQRATEIMDQADADSTRLVQGVVDTFSNIANF
jgi:uncharacterized protein YukE